MLPGICYDEVAENGAKREKRNEENPRTAAGGRAAFVQSHRLEGLKRPPRRCAGHRSAGPGGRGAAAIRSRRRQRASSGPPPRPKRHLAGRPGGRRALLDADRGSDRSRPQPPENPAQLPSRRRPEPLPRGAGQPDPPGGSRRRPGHQHLRTAADLGPGSHSPSQGLPGRHPRPGGGGPPGRPAPSGGAGLRPGPGPGPGPEGLPAHRVHRRHPPRPDQPSPLGGVPGRDEGRRSSRGAGHLPDPGTAGRPLRPFWTA